MRSVLFMPLLLALACGGDEQTDGEKACDELEAHLAECSLTTQAQCNDDQPCAVRCYARGECSEISGPMPTGSVLQCLATCSGAGPDDFVCADGRQFVNESAMCDGQFHCLDGSDELGCPGGGTAGTGTGG